MVPRVLPFNLAILDIMFAASWPIYLPEAVSKKNEDSPMSSYLCQARPTVLQPQIKREDSEILNGRRPKLVNQRGQI